MEAYKGDLFNKSYYPTSADASNSTKRWYVIDAEGQTLGRLATLAATYIRCEPHGPMQTCSRPSWASWRNLGGRLPALPCITSIWCL